MKTNEDIARDETAQRELVLHIIQPGLAGFMDGSVSSFLYLLLLIQLVQVLAGGVIVFLAGMFIGKR